MDLILETILRVLSGTNGEKSIQITLDSDNRELRIRLQTWSKNGLVAKVVDQRFPIRTLLLDVEHGRNTFCSALITAEKVIETPNDEKEKEEKESSG